METRFVSRRLNSFSGKHFGAELFAYDLVLLPFKRPAGRPRPYGSLNLHSLSPKTLSRFLRDLISENDNENLRRALWNEGYDKTVLSASQAAAGGIAVDDSICVVLVNPRVENQIYPLMTVVSKIVDDSIYGEDFIWLSADDIGKEFDISDVTNAMGPDKLFLTPKQQFRFTTLKNESSATPLIELPKSRPTEAESSEE